MKHRSLTASLLASSVSYFLISWQKPSRFFSTTVEYFLEYFKIFHSVNFTVEQKFSRENFRSLLKIRENRESFLTVKPLLFTVCLFTCASTRAIDLEQTPDMGVDSFLLAMRRFASGEDYLQLLCLIMRRHQQRS